ncbi:MAG TPA: thioredoxin domain-containing protein [Nitrospiria bacterium]|nr:thioredoxin domain-containing protein [Nitrospiria bacterium]HUK56902.1 thioredoxin domain-containing protein [Nitrospiria bacterium]
MPRSRSTSFKAKVGRFARILPIVVLCLAVVTIGSFAPIHLRIGIGEVSGEETPAVDYDAIEAFLKKLTAKQPIVSLTVIHRVEPSPVPGLQQVKFVIEMNGQRQNGLVYLSGSKIFLGQIFDLGTQENLTEKQAGASQPVHYDIKDLDLENRVPRGTPGGRLVIVEFSDFQCPFCKQATKPLGELLRKYPEDVVIYYKHMPITEIHPLAYKMALASECARTQKAGAFWVFHDRFFSDPPIRDAAQLRDQIGQWARQQGLDTKKFLTCYDNAEQAPRIEKDMNDARTIGVNSTPTFLLNGEFVAGVQSLERFERYLEAK